MIEVCIGLHDHARISAQLQYNALFSGLALEHPADGRTPGKTDHLEPLVHDHLLGKRIGARQDAHHAGRQAGLQNDLAQQQRSQRRLRRGFEDDGIAGRQRGRNLVGHEVQRKIERCDAEDRTNGDAARYGKVMIRARRDIQWNDFAGDSLRFLRSHREGRDGPPDFPPGIGDRFPGLRGETAGKLLLAGPHLTGDLLQCEGTSVCRQLTADRERGNRCANGFLGLCFSGQTDVRQTLAVEWIVNRTRGPSLHPPSGNQHCAPHHHRHHRHVL